MQELFHTVKNAIPKVKQNDAYKMTYKEPLCFKT